MEIERSEVKFMNLDSSTELVDENDDGHIPEWLLLEVLTRLPAKLVCGSKLVSKKWLSLIIEPSFVRTYISRASLLSHPWTFISHFMHHKDSKSLHFPGFVLLDDINSQALKPNYCVLPLPCTQESQCGENRYMIFGVSNGLVLYGLNSQSVEDIILTRTFYICSPVTGQWIALPPFTCCFIPFGWGFLTHVEDGFLKSYTVVRVNMLPRTSNYLKFEVFSSEIGEWKIFTVSAGLEISLSVPRQATTLNGILHWIAFKHGIIAYDPHQSPERMRVIPFPAISSIAIDNIPSVVCALQIKGSCDTLNELVFPCLEIDSQVSKFGYSMTIVLEIGLCIIQSTIGTFNMIPVLPSSYRI